MKNKKKKQKQKQKQSMDNTFNIFNNKTINKITTKQKRKENTKIIVIDNGQCVKIVKNDKKKSI
jgi:hypothetical protein